jgi:hypothetical protein
MRLVERLRRWRPSRRARAAPGDEPDVTRNGDAGDAHAEKRAAAAEAEARRN